LDIADNSICDPLLLEWRLPEGAEGDATATDDEGIIGDGASYWLTSQAFIIIFLSVGIFSQKIQRITCCYVI
jgi:hypothetical protein